MPHAQIPILLSPCTQEPDGSPAKAEDRTTGPADTRSPSRVLELWEMGEDDVWRRITPCPKAPPKLF